MYSKAPVIYYSWLHHSLFNQAAKCHTGVDVDDNFLSAMLSVRLQTNLTIFRYIFYVYWFAAFFTTVSRYTQPIAVISCFYYDYKMLA